MGKLWSKIVFLWINFIIVLKNVFVDLNQYFSILWIDWNSEIQLGFNDTQFNKYFKIFIFPYSIDFLNINPHLRCTFFIFVKNVFYKHVLIFPVEYFFASLKLFQKNSRNYSGSLALLVKFKKIFVYLASRSRLRNEVFLATFLLVFRSRDSSLHNSFIENNTFYFYK